MLIYEEYLRRHNISVPHVGHFKHGNLLLRLDPIHWGQRWMIVSVGWEEPNTHPGNFIVNFMFPNHDGSETGEFFNRLEPIRVHWDGYEDYFLLWVKNLQNARPVMNQQEIVLSMWEMFVSMYDTWFSRQSYEIKTFLFDTLNEESSIAVRYKAYERMLHELEFSGSDVMSVWEYEMLQYTRDYAGWLANLLENRYNAI